MEKANVYDFEKKKHRRLKTGKSKIILCILCLLQVKLKEADKFLVKATEDYILIGGNTA